jgi:uncharacterized protein (TIGR02466 family)
MNVQTIFPTPLLISRKQNHEELNRNIKRIISDRRKADKGIDSTNIGGWHSSPDLWEWPDREIAEIRAFVKDCAREITLSHIDIENYKEIEISPYGGAWVNLLNNGGYNQVHNHPGAVWSAVYYVDCGAPSPKYDKNGDFEFLDPRSANIFGTKHTIRPESGLCLVFPSWMQHFVHPHYGKRPRISMAFNLDVRILV